MQGVRANQRLAKENGGEKGRLVGLGVWYVGDREAQYIPSVKIVFSKFPTVPCE